MLTVAQGAVSPIVNLALVAEFPIAELPVTTITRLHYTHITAADNALVSILEISNFDIDVHQFTQHLEKMPNRSFSLLKAFPNFKCLISLRKTLLKMGIFTSCLKLGCFSAMIFIDKQF